MLKNIVNIVNPVNALRYCYYSSLVEEIDRQLAVLDSEDN